MGDLFTNPVRHPEDIGISYLRRTLNFSDYTPGVLTMPIGALEAGSIPLRLTTYVEIAVAGGTPAVSIGNASSAVAYALAADVAAGATGVKTAATGVGMGIPLATDTVILATISTGATAGKFTVVMEFANKRDGGGRTFPAN